MLHRPIRLALFALTVASLAACSESADKTTGLKKSFSVQDATAPASGVSASYDGTTVTVSWTGSEGGRYHVKITCVDTCTGNVPDNPNEIAGSGTSFTLATDPHSALTGNWQACVNTQSGGGWADAVCANFAGGAAPTPGDGGGNGGNGGGSDNNPPRGPSDQTVSWNTDSHTYGDAPFNLDFSASSGNAPELAATNGKCSVANDGTVTIMEAGQCNIHYGVAGNDTLRSAQGEIHVNINPAQMSITVGDVTMNYGDPAPTFSVTYDHFVYSDDASVFNGQLHFTGAPDPMAAGEFTISAGGLHSNNYDITYHTGTLKVNRAPLSVIANDATAIYGNTPSFSVQYSGFVYNDDASSLGGALAFSTNPTPVHDVGSYAIIPGGLTSGNYDITFGNGTLTVTPRNLNLYPAVVAAQLGTTPACNIQGNSFGYTDNVGSLTWVGGPGCSFTPNPFWLSGGVQSIVGSPSSPNYVITMSTSAFTAFGPFAGTAVGFLPPIGPTMPLRAPYKMGSTIPAKFRLIGSNGQAFRDPAAVFTACRVAAANATACIDAVVVTASFNYDAAAGQHIFTWNTTKTTPLGIYLFKAALSQGPNDILGWVEITK